MSSMNLHRDFFYSDRVWNAAKCYDLFLDVKRSNFWANICFFLVSVCMGCIMSVSVQPLRAAWAEIGKWANGLLTRWQDRIFPRLNSLLSFLLIFAVCLLGLFYFLISSYFSFFLLSVESVSSPCRNDWSVLIGLQSWSLHVFIPSDTKIWAPRTGLGCIGPALKVTRTGREVSVVRSLWSRFTGINGNPGFPTNWGYWGIRGMWICIPWTMRSRG